MPISAFFFVDIFFVLDVDFFVVVFLSAPVVWLLAVVLVVAEVSLVVVHEVRKPTATRIAIDEISVRFIGCS